MAFFAQEDDFSAELAAIDRVCEADRQAREQHELAVAMAASVEMERARKIKEANIWAEQEKRRIRQERVYFDTVLEPRRLAEQMKFDALSPAAGEVKIQCPWCSKAWLLEVNCGIAHCGVERVGQDVRQLPAHGAAGEFAGRVLVSGCGRQFKYNRATKRADKCAGQ